MYYLTGRQVKSANKPSSSSDQSVSGFCSMKQLGIFLLPPGWDASPSQGYPQNSIHQYSLIHVHLGGDRHCVKSLA